MPIRQVTRCPPSSQMRGALASHPVTTIHGHEFVTVGARRPPARASQRCGSFVNLGGSISPGVTRPRSRGQWVEFIDAYRPYIAVGDYGDPQFTGSSGVAGVGPTACRGTRC